MVRFGVCLFFGLLFAFFLFTFRFLLLPRFIVTLLSELLTQCIAPPDKLQENADPLFSKCASHSVPQSWPVFLVFLLLILERGEWREGEKYLCERSIDQLPTNCADWGPNPQHSHVLWLGIEPMTFQIARWCPSNWITPARVWPVFLFHKNCAPFLCQVKSHSSFECRLWGITSNTVHFPLSLG